MKNITKVISKYQIPKWLLKMAYFTRSVNKLRHLHIHVHFLVDISLTFETYRCCENRCARWYNYVTNNALWHVWKCWASPVDSNFVSTGKRKRPKWQHTLDNTLRWQRTSMQGMNRPFHLQLYIGYYSRIAEYKPFITNTNIHLTIQCNNHRQRSTEMVKIIWSQNACPLQWGDHASNRDERLYNHSQSALKLFWKHMVVQTLLRHFMLFFCFISHPSVYGLSSISDLIAQVNMNNDQTHPQSRRSTS